MSDLTFVFVHGLSGWGSYDPAYRRMPYWGMRGGATIRMFSELLANGDVEERVGTPVEDLSPLFRGGQADRIHSLITLASPLNGTTAYDMFADPDFSPDDVTVPWWSNPLQAMMSKGTGPVSDGRDNRDYAGYDMHLDRARELNIRLAPLGGAA